MHTYSICFHGKHEKILYGYPLLLGAMIHLQQEKRLTALWMGFLNNKESKSLACETPTGPPSHPYQIQKQSTEEER